ncbi:hypothetical protein VTP01DRAFT_777 [Rhizomucor pusillus]|uniref:uncharacterized protein n=1 Tax=Rhizomucor pusillus TaxID=4840 RepID=UPI0037420A61
MPAIEKESDNAPKEVKETEKEEPIQINKYDCTQLKNAIDDEVKRYYSVEEGYQEGHLHTDVKLLVGYSSCLLAGGAFLFEYYTSFEEAKPIVAVAVVVFWILQAFFWLYTTFVEKNVIYIGYKQDAKSGERLGTLTVSSKMEQYSPIYEMTYEYVDSVLKKGVSRQMKTNVSTWFTEDGILVKEALDKDLKEAASGLLSQLHTE